MKMGQERNRSIIWHKSQKKREIKDYTKISRSILESDNHLYRVRKPYQKAIEDISSEDKNIHLVIEKLLDEDDFLDHCHPLPKGQESQKIQEIYVNWD